MNNYINPFEYRTFSQRFKCIFAFMKQNFIPVMKFELPVFIVISALLSWVTTTNPNLNLNNLGSIINFAAFAYFTHYITKQGATSKIPFKNILQSIGKAFAKIFEASLIPLGFGLLLAIIVGIFMFVVMVLFKDNPIILVLSFLPILGGCIYIIPIINIYYIHFYFSSKLSHGLDILKESFLLVKGHWWSTFGFMTLFEIVQIVIFLPLILISSEKTFVGEWISNLALFIIAFFCIHTVTLFQYGHLKTLRDEKKQNE